MLSPTQKEVLLGLNNGQNIAKGDTFEAQVKLHVLQSLRKKGILDFEYQKDKKFRITFLENVALTGDCSFSESQRSFLCKVLQEQGSTIQPGTAMTMKSDVLRWRRTLNALQRKGVLEYLIVDENSVRIEFLQSITHEEVAFIEPQFQGLKSVAGIQASKAIAQYWSVGHW